VINKTMNLANVLKRSLQVKITPCILRFSCLHVYSKFNCKQEVHSTNNFIDTTQFKQDEIPKSALYLGFGGAIPFVTLALASGITPDHYINTLGFAQISYGACILTFLGGVHWGKEIMTNTNNPDMKTMVWSVIPSLYAWSAFVLPHSFALYYLSVGLTSVAFFDINDTTLPKWYRKLRGPLTMLAATSLAVTGYNISS